MEFLKALFNGEALTYEQLAEKVKGAKLNVANIADGSYVSRAKFDDTTNGLKQQVTDLQGQLSRRDTDMADLSTKLAAAQADAAKLPDAQNALTAMQSKYDADKKDWETKTARQAYEFAVKTEAGKLDFSSAAARRDFIRGAMDAGFKMDGETLLGFTDYVQKYKTDDPTAFKAEAPTTPTQQEPTQEPTPPTIVLPSSPAPSDKNVFGFNFHGVRPKPTE